MGALIALASGVVSRLGGAFGGRAAARALPAIAAIGGGTFIGSELSERFSLGGGGGATRRRRRRSALTAGDMRTALTIASAISKKAAENFILTRTRNS